MKSVRRSPRLACPLLLLPYDEIEAGLMPCLTLEDAVMLMQTCRALLIPILSAYSVSRRELYKRHMLKMRSCIEMRCTPSFEHYKHESFVWRSLNSLMQVLELTFAKIVKCQETRCMLSVRQQHDAFKCTHKQLQFIIKTEVTGIRQRDKLGDTNLKAMQQLFAMYDIFQQKGTVPLKTLIIATECLSSLPTAETAARH